MTVLAYDWDTGELVRNFDYLTRVMMPGVEVEIVSADQFEKAVAEQRAKVRRPKRDPQRFRSVDSGIRSQGNARAVNQEGNTDSTDQESPEESVESAQSVSSAVSRFLTR